MLKWKNNIGFLKMIIFVVNFSYFVKEIPYYKNNVEFFFQKKLLDCEIRVLNRVLNKIHYKKM
jgi:hypothetical protein